MTTTAFENLTDDDVEALDDDERADYDDWKARQQRRDTNRDGFNGRKLAKERDAALAAQREAEAKLAKFERRDALAEAKRGLNAEGPIDAFLKVYDGEPTTDAIREAVAKDPEFSGLITIPPDIRDEAAREQWNNAQAMREGSPAGTGEVSPAAAAQWAPETIDAFRTNHPDEWDRLLKGENVQVPATTVTTS